MSISNKLFFQSGYQVTQNFGENPQIYARLGLKGHNGIDLIPANNSFGAVVYCPISGTVIKKSYDPNGYGNWCMVWNKEMKICVRFAHFARPTGFNIGDEVQTNQDIGIMGSTGFSTGEHVHFEVIPVNDLGVKTNPNNGYFGAIDPLPYIREWNNKQSSTNQTTTQMPTTNTPEIYGWNNEIPANRVPINYLNSDRRVFINTLLDRDDEIAKFKKEVDNLKGQIFEMNKPKLVPINSDDVYNSREYTDLDEKYVTLKTKYEDLLRNQTVVSNPDAIQTTFEGQPVPLPPHIAKVVSDGEYEGVNKISVLSGWLKNNVSTIGVVLGAAGVSVSQDDLSRYISVGVSILGFLVSYIQERYYRKS